MMPCRYWVTLVLSLRQFVTLLTLLSGIFPARISSAQGTADKLREIEQHEALARQALDQKHPDVAIAEYQAILKLDPKNAEARGNLGVIAFLQGNCTVAGDHFEQALKLQPSLWKAQAMLGICEKYRGHPKQAKLLLEESFPHLKEPRLQIRAGLALVELDYQQGQLEEALPVLGALQEADPANVDVLYVLYRIHTDLADQARDKIGLVAPDSARMHEILAQHLINEGDAEHAVEQYREALRIDPHLPGVHFELGEALLQNNFPSPELARQNAQKEFETALQLNPQDQKSECRLGAIYFLQNNFSEALAHFSRAEELNPADPEAHIGLGRVLAATDQPQIAMEHFRRSVQLDPLNANAHFQLSRLYRRLGRNEEADRETAAFKKLREAKDRLRSTYEGVYKAPQKQDILGQDSPQ
jgi:tetratricopeptide (TPR) repeat protein